MLKRRSARRACAEDGAWQQAQDGTSYEAAPARGVDQAESAAPAYGWKAAEQTAPETDGAGYAADDNDGSMPPAGDVVGQTAWDAAADAGAAPAYGDEPVYDDAPVYDEPAYDAPGDAEPAYAPAGEDGTAYAAPEEMPEAQDDGAGAPPAPYGDDVYAVPDENAPLPDDAELHPRSVFKPRRSVQEAFAV